MAIGSLAPKEFPKFPDTDRAEGIFAGFWTGRDEAGQSDGQPALFQSPIGIPNVRYNLVAINPKLPDGVRAPGSFEWPHEFVLFGSAFGLEQNAVKGMLNPNAPVESLKQLSAALEAKKGIVHFAAHDKNKTGKGAWIDSIEEMKLPDGKYYGKFLRFTTKANGVASHKTYPGFEGGPPQEKAMGLLEVIAPAAYAGRTVLFSLPYPLEPDMYGNPAFQSMVQKKGAAKGVMVDRVSVERFKAFLNTATGQQDFAGAFDPNDCADKNNILPEVEKAIQAAAMTMLFKVEKKFVRVETIEGLLPGTVLPTEGASKAVVKEAATPELSKAAVELYNVLQARLGADVKAFNNDGTYTEAAKEWLSANLAPICDRLGYRKAIKVLTTAQIVEVLKELGETTAAERAAMLEDNVTSDF